MASKTTQFVLSFFIVGMVSFGISGIFIPPDPILDLLSFIVLIPVVVVVSYVLSYRFEFEWI